MRIAILDDYQLSSQTMGLPEPHRLTRFTRPAPDRQTLIERLLPFDALILIRERTRLDAALLTALPNLKVISQTGRVSGHIDLAACERLGITVLEGGGSPVAPAELTWALILAASKRLQPYHASLHRGEWQWGAGASLGRTLAGLTLGIWGFGKIGQRVARFGEALGMKVLVWGSDSSRQAAIAAGYSAAPDKGSLFAQSDVLSLHLRLVEATRGCVALDELAQMKPDGLLVNTSRAELIAPGALEAALRAGCPGAAALDVYEQEPLLDSPLFALPNVLCSPHLGYVTEQGMAFYLQEALANLAAWLEANP